MKKIFTLLTALVLFSSMSWAWYWGDDANWAYQSCKMGKNSSGVIKISAYEEVNSDREYETKFYFVVGTGVNYVPTGTYTISTSNEVGTVFSSSSSYTSSLHTVSAWASGEPGSCDYLVSAGTIYVYNPNNSTPTYVYATFTSNTWQGSYIVTMGTGTPPSSGQTITFMNGADTLQTGKVNKDVSPTYTGATPTKSSSLTTDYTFSGWTDGSTNYTANETLPVVGSTDVTYTATFSESTRQYTITITTPEHGTIMVKNGETTINNGESVNYGTTLTVTTEPETGYEFGSWTDNGAASVTVNGAITIGATFQLAALNKYNITLLGADGCSTKLTIGSNSYTVEEDEEQLISNIPEGTSITFTLTPTDDSYNYGEFWSDDNHGTVLHYADASESVVTWQTTITQDMKVYGYCAIKQFNLADVVTNEYYTTTIPWGKSVRTMILNRSFSANKWGTLCLPFNADLSDAQKQMVYQMEDATLTGDLLNVSFSKVNQVDAGKPYMFKGKTATTNPQFDYIYMPETIVMGDSTETDNAVVRYVGVLNETILLPAGHKELRYLASNTLYYPRANKGGTDSFTGTTISNGRAYFHIIKSGYSAAPRMRIFVNDEIIEEDNSTAEMETKKYIEDGILVIERNGVKYTAEGFTIKE